VYFDSDLIVADPRKSVESVLDNPASHTLLWGAPLSNTTIGFLPNLPWHQYIAVCAFFYFRPGPRASRFLQFWWMSGYEANKEVQ